MTHPFEPPAQSDRDMSRATWMIGIAAALVFGMAVGAAVGDPAGPAACAPRESVAATPTGD